MTPGVRPLVAGNWKMNGLSASLGEIEAMRRAADAGEAGEAELAVCPPATLLAQARLEAQGRQALARRPGLPARRRAAPSPATFPPPMLKDAGASYVIVGHSERRTIHNETDALVRAKAEAALKAGPRPRSSASARPRLSARRASRPPSSFGSSEGRCPAGGTPRDRGRRL